MPIITHKAIIIPVEIGVTTIIIITAGLITAVVDVIGAEAAEGAEIRGTTSNKQITNGITSNSNKTNMGKIGVDIKIPEAIIEGVKAVIGHDAAEAEIDTAEVVTTVITAVITIISMKAINKFKPLRACHHRNFNRLALHYQLNNKFTVRFVIYQDICRLIA